MDIVATIWLLIMGMVSGIITATVGYTKGQNLENIDYRKFFLTVGVGAFVGLVTAWKGWDYNQAEDWINSTGYIFIVNYVLLIIWRRVIAPIMDKKKAKVKIKVKKVKDEEE